MFGIFAVDMWEISNDFGDAKTCPFVALSVSAAIRCVAMSCHSTDLKTSTGLSKLLDEKKIFLKRNH